MFDTPDDSSLAQEGLQVFSVHYDLLMRRGYPTHLAHRLAYVLVRDLCGIEMDTYWAFPTAMTAIPEEDKVFNVRDLSRRFHLEHDGSALEALLERYGYAVRTGPFWVLTLTERARAAGAGFHVPGKHGYATILWRPAVVEQCLVLEKMQRSLASEAGPDLLIRHYFSPQELGGQRGWSTRRVNQVLATAGLQVREGRRWRPKGWQTIAERPVSIYGWRGLEWLPQVLDGLAVSEGKGW